MNRKTEPDRFTVPDNIWENTGENRISVTIYGFHCYFILVFKDLLNGKKRYII